jgi:hypothetical protein
MGRHSSTVAAGWKAASSCLRRLRRGLASGACVLLLIGTAQVRVGSSEARGAACPTMELVAVRGSGEHSGFGPTLWSLVKDVRRFARSAHADSIEYPAVNVHPWEPRYNANYINSVTQGTSALRLFVINHLRSRCSKTRLVLAGYSQGAEVVDDVLQASLTSGEQANIVGVVLFGDPRFNPTQALPVDVGTFDHALSGISPYQYQPPSGTFGTLAVYSSPNAAKIRSYCAESDQICNYSSPGALARCAVSCAHFHYMDLKIDKPWVTYTQAAASFLRARMSAPPPATSCAGSLVVHPGVGDITITQIQVRRVSCANARTAIAIYERDRPPIFQVNSRGFQCQRRTVGDPGNTSYRTTCLEGTQLVTWQSVAAI